MTEKTFDEVKIGDVIEENIGSEIVQLVENMVKN